MLVWVGLERSVVQHVMTTANGTFAAETSAPSAPLWRELRARVRDWAPDLIVVVARKMPRIDEALQLDLASIATTVSDLALPFCADFLRDARVAVVDDIINVGSTVDHVRDTVQRHRAKEIRTFALHLRDRVGKDLPDIVGHVGLADSEYDILRQEAPRLIARLAKPYDLDFPIMGCTLASPLSTGQDLVFACEERFGAQAFAVSRSFGDWGRQTRISVDLVSRGSAVDKIRLYYDETSGVLNLVPMRISSPVQEGKTWARFETLGVLQKRLLEFASSESDDFATAARVHLFVDSLRLGIESIHQFEGIVRPPRHRVLSVPDAELVFGPASRDMFESLAVDDLLVNARPSARTPQAQGVRATSPAFERLWVNRLLPEVRSRSKSSDPLVVAMCLFDVLADSIGNQNASDYSLQWPYLASQVAQDPYKRLKIGFTFGDLVAILRSVAGGGRTTQGWRRTTSKILDQLIDAGMVVPTFANYEGLVYRVYRKGEADPRLPAVESVMRGLQFYGAPMPGTRLSKVALITSFVVSPGDGAGPGVAPRGNVLQLDADVLDGDAEVTQFGLRTGRFIRTDGAAGVT